MSQRTPQYYLDAILERWSCSSGTCKNHRKGHVGYCFILEDSTHAEFDRQDAAAWEKAIIRDDNTFVTVEKPPPQLVDLMVKKNRRLHPKRASAPGVEATMPSLTLGLDDIYKLHTILGPLRPTFSPDKDDKFDPIFAQSVPRPPARSSPVHPDSDVEEEVSNYVAFMMRKYPGQMDGWVIAKEKLNRESLDLRQIRTMSNAEFKEVGIPMGIGMKLREDVKNFKAERDGRS
jgi:hypothetical protein